MGLGQNLRLFDHPDLLPVTALETPENHHSENDDETAAQLKVGVTPVTNPISFPFPGEMGAGFSATSPPARGLNKDNTSTTRTK